MKELTEVEIQDLVRVRDIPALWNERVSALGIPKRYTRDAVEKRVQDGSLVPVGRYKHRFYFTHRDVMAVHLSPLRGHQTQKDGEELQHVAVRVCEVCNDGLIPLAVPDWWWCAECRTGRGKEWRLHYKSEKMRGTKERKAEQYGV